MKLQSKDFIYVISQFILLGLYLLDLNIFEFKITIVIRYISLLILILGIFIFGLALIQLNKNLSPFPTPKNDSNLIESGLYKYIRHPIYTGILLIVFGYGVYSQSEFKLIISLLLLILFYFKSSYEEQQLNKKFEKYIEFKRKTGRFFPKWF